MLTISIYMLYAEASEIYALQTTVDNKLPIALISPLRISRNETSDVSYGGFIFKYRWLYHCVDLVRGDGYRQNFVMNCISQACSKYVILINILRPMDAISQTTFSNAFAWMKMYAFWIRFHWSLFLGGHINNNPALAPTRRQTIIQTNDG